MDVVGIVYHPEKEEAYPVALAVESWLQKQKVSTWLARGYDGDAEESVLREQPNPVRVEGHTDSRPINSFRFPSNWELSAARAASVVHLFVREQVDPERLVMVGYGEHRPRVDNDGPAGHAANRRVVLMVLAAPDTPGARPADVPDSIATAAPPAAGEGGES